MSTVEVIPAGLQLCPAEHQLSPRLTPLRLTPP
jgi:hypothetical protein